MEFKSESEIFLLLLSLYCFFRLCGGLAKKGGLIFFICYYCYRETVQFFCLSLFVLFFLPRMRDMTCLEGVSYILSGSSHYSTPLGVFVESGSCSITRHTGWRRNRASRLGARKLVFAPEHWRWRVTLN